MFKWTKLITLSLGLFCLSNQAVAKFMSVDPVGAQQHINKGNVQGFNRYAYANNNPYKYTDPDGRIAETVWDAANVAMGVASMGNNISNGNYGAATIDALGVIVDGAATMAPVVPGGAGTAIKAVRTATEATFKTGKEAATQAGKLGYKEVKGVKSQGEKVFHNKKGEPKFITRDRTGHKGGAFKGADSAKDLGKKETRAGTYNQDLKKIDD